MVAPDGLLEAVLANLSGNRLEQFQHPLCPRQSLQLRVSDRHPCACNTVARTSGFSAILCYGRLKETLTRHIVLKEAREGC